MFDWLYTALGAMMRFFNTITGTYALALLFYALIFKIVFLPFSIKQQKNQVKMAKLTPKIELIKAKYKGRTDQPTMQKQQQEIMELQQKEGYNPMSGCLPLLIQLPIIMLLYTVIQGPLSYIAKPTETFKAYNDDYESVSVTDSEYADFLAHYGITTDEEKKELSRTDLSFRLYLDFSSDTEEQKQSVIDTFNKDKEKKGSDKAYKNLKKTLKVKEITLVGDIRDYVDNGYTMPSYITELIAKRDGGDELTEAQLGWIEKEEARKTKLSAIESADARAAYIESYGIEYASIPNFMLWGVNLAATPSIKNISILCIIPILAAAAQWVSMWLMRKFNGNPNGTTEADKQTQSTMKMMDIMMPAMTLFIAFSFSGMLGLYWIYQSLLGLLTSFIIAKIWPIPKFTEEEIKELRRQQKEAEKAQRVAAKSGPKYRSLHYIDDDDYDELPPVPKTEGSSKNVSSDKPEIKD